jgi:hypothetical protein
VTRGLTTRAWLELLRVDLIQLRGFRATRRAVAGTRRVAVAYDQTTVDDVTTAVRHACLWYFKPIWCLQRSAVMTRLLRRRGVPAEMVVGCNHAPFSAHAWVEVLGRIVSDPLDEVDHYKILDRW